MPDEPVHSSVRLFQPEPGIAFSLQGSGLAGALFRVLELGCRFGARGLGIDCRVWSGFWALKPRWLPYDPYPAP